MYQVLIRVFFKDCFISYKTTMRYVFSLSYLYSVITKVLFSLWFIGSHKNLHFKGINTHTQIWVLYFAKYKDSTHCISFIHSYHWLTATPNSRKPQFLFSSVQFSRSVMSDSLRPHESQHARPPYLSPTPGVHPNSCPSSRCWHPTISSSAVPFSSCPQSLPASQSFPMSQLFA